MKKKICLGLGTALLLAGTAAQPVSATTVIDTTSWWYGEVNYGSAGSGQSLTVPVDDNVLESFTFYADAQSNGRLFDIYAKDAIDNGSTLFSLMNFSVVTGANTVHINQAFTSGSTILVQMNYQGFSGPTVHWLESDYTGGMALFFGELGNYIDFPWLDLEFIAVFNSGGSSVPDAGSTLAMLGVAFAGLAAVHSRKSA